MTSLVYTDVNQNKVLFTTVNQWFDESIFYENAIKKLYYHGNYMNLKNIIQNFLKSLKCIQTK